MMYVGVLTMGWSNMERILVVEDEAEISEFIELYLKKERYEVAISQMGSQALELAGSFQPNLIILDIMLPDMDGLEVCLKLRNVTNVPILFVSCKGDEMDKIVGLSMGGDDYITKPFSPRELIARVKAHLRRTKMPQNEIAAGRNVDDAILRFEGLEINPVSREVKVNGEIIRLSSTEFELLHKLSKQPNRVFPQLQLYDQIWGEYHAGDTRTLMVHISNLRKKIEKDPVLPQYIITVRGAGYKFLGVPFSQETTH
jgi:DNA-binding response OmpR family regulator